MKTILLAFLLAATAATAAPLDAVMVDTNGVQRVPAMLTLTNVVIEGFTFEDISDLDITDRSVDDVIAWDGTNHVYVAQGGHDPATVTGGLLTLSGQQIGLSTSTVRTAVSGLYMPLSGGIITSAGGGLSNIIAWDTGSVVGGLYVDAADGRFKVGGDIDNGTIWHSGIDGAGSDLDSDLLDGQHGSYYRNAANHTNQVMVIRGDQWTGPQVSEKPGWAIKSFDLAGETKLLARGFQDFSGTQYTATADSEFRTPTDSTGFRTTAAILVTLLADSTTSSICSYRLYVYKNATQIYDSGASQTVASTSAKHVVSIPASSLGTFTAGATYTVRVEASVKYDSPQAKGIYFVGTPTIQVIK